MGDGGGYAKEMIASSTIAKDVTGLAETVPGHVTDLVGTVKERLPETRPEIPFPDISLAELAARLQHLRLPDVAVSDLAARLPQMRLPGVDVSELADRLRELPAVGAALPRQRSVAGRLAVAAAVAGVAVGAVLVVRRRRARRDRPSEQV